MKKELKIKDLANLLCKAQVANKILVIETNDQLKLVVIAINGDTMVAYPYGKPSNQARSYFVLDVLPTITKTSIE